MAQSKRFFRTRPQESAAPDEFAFQRETVGELLCRQRESLGHDLRAVSQVLRIRFVHLQAIESGRYEELPGVPYAVGFVRTYADYLGLDSAAVVAQFKEEISGLQRQKMLVFPEPKPESRVPGGAIILISVLLVILAYGGWYVLSKDERAWVEMLPSFSEEAAEEVAAVSETPAAAPEPADDASAPPAEEATDGETPTIEATASEATQDEPQDATDVIAEAITENVPEAAATTGDAIVLSPPATETASAADAAELQAAAGDATAPQTAAIPEAPSSEEPALATGGRVPRAYGTVNEGARIVLRATSDSWVQVRDQNDGVLFSRVLQPGDSYQVPNRGDLVLLTGNAGGLDVLVDGQASPQLGPRGAVRRNVVLDPERLLAGTAID